MLEKLMLGVNTAVIGMGIVFLVLYILSLIIKAQSKIFDFALRNAEGAKKASSVSPIEQRPTFVDKKGNTSGEAVLIEVDDDDTAAAIMAVVSDASSIPLPSLKIKSIKRVD